MPWPSMVFQLRDERVRAESMDSGTCLGAPALHRPQPFDAKRLFVERYATIRAALERHPRQGLAILAFDAEARPAGEAWVEASLDRTRAVIIGRHSACGIVVPGEHASVSLRHVCVLARANTHEEVRVRVVDLHSGLGFGDEAGRALESITADGSLFLAIGPLRLALLVTGPSPMLPSDPEVAYSAIPGRVFIEERGFERRPGMLFPQLPRVDGQTLIRAQPGPVTATSQLLRAGEPVVARLTMMGAELTVTREIGATALDRGLVIGRYSRCDVRTGDDAEVISRVHLLIVRDGVDLLAIDAASSNGSYVGGQPFRARVLRDDTRVRLGTGDELELRLERA